MNISQIYEREKDVLLSLIEDNNGFSQKRDYNAKTIISGDMVEVLIYETWPTGFANKNKLKQISRVQQEHLNFTNSQMKCVRKMNANFTSKDSWITLTYSNKHLPWSEEDADKQLRNYIARIKRRCDKEIKYIYATEIGRKGRVHHHLVINVSDRNMLEELWTTSSELARKRKNSAYQATQLGRTVARRLQPDDFGLTGMAKYITKESAKNKKKFRCSKNLILPTEIKTKNLKGKKLTKSFVKKLAEDETAAKLEFLKMFPTCQFNNIEVKQTPYTKGYYIYVHMKTIDEKRRN